MIEEASRVRLGAALRGENAVPSVGGLTFAPLDVLISVSPACGSHGECIVAAAAALGLDFVFVPESAPWAEDVVRSRGDLGVLWVVDGPLWPSLAAFGSVREGLAQTARDPASITPGLELETSRGLEAIERGLGLDVDGVVVAEDLAGSRGLLVSPEFAGDHIMPLLQRLVRRAGGRPVVFHSDGDTRQLLKLLRAAGFSGVHTGGGIDRDSFEALFWAARREGLVVMGGIDTASLARGTFASVRAGTRAALLAQTGGLIVADDGGIVSAEEMAGYAAALGVLRGVTEPVRLP